MLTVALQQGGLCADGPCNVCCCRRLVAVSAAVQHADDVQPVRPPPQYGPKLLPHQVLRLQSSSLSVAGQEQAQRPGLPGMQCSARPWLAFFLCSSLDSFWRMTHSTWMESCLESARFRRTYCKMPCDSCTPGLSAVMILLVAFGCVCWPVKATTLSPTHIRMLTSDCRQPAEWLLQAARSHAAHEGSRKRGDKLDQSSRTGYSLRCHESGGLTGSASTKAVEVPGCLA